MDVSTASKKIHATDRTTDRKKAKVINFCLGLVQISKLHSFRVITLNNKNPQLLINELIDIMNTLRHPKHGCPWDVEQTFDTIIPYTIEETYEVIDAVEKRDWSELKNELGDLLLQILFYTQMASEQKLFDFADVATALKEKLIRRHPHVFGEKNEQGNPVEKADWNGIKAKERSDRQPKDEQSIFANIPASLPALEKAIKLQKRCAKVGFDWQSYEPVIDKIHEEIDEVLQEVQMEDKNQTRIEEEVGDLLFAVTNLARHLKCNPETALRQANNKFIKRFTILEQKAIASGKALEAHSLAELENYWQQAKFN